MIPLVNISEDKAANSWASYLGAPSRPTPGTGTGAGTSDWKYRVSRCPDGHLWGEFLMISFLQLHETPLFHNILNGSFSGSRQSCFILGERRGREGKVSLKTKVKNWGEKRLSPTFPWIWCTMINSLSLPRTHYSLPFYTALTPLCLCTSTKNQDIEQRSSELLE